MIVIKTLSEFSPLHLKSMGLSGYTTNFIYDISFENNIYNTCFNFKLALKAIDTPLTKTYPDNSETFNEYKRIIAQGNSICAYDENILAGVSIVEMSDWNNSLNIHFIEIAEVYRHKGIGTMLLEKTGQLAKSIKANILRLETQNTNVPAINFYLKNGFEITGLNADLYFGSPYQNETAIFMTKKIIH